MITQHFSLHFSHHTPLHMKQPNKPKATKAILDALYGTQDFKSFRGDTDYTEPKISAPKRNMEAESEGSKQTEPTEWSIQASCVAWFGRNYPSYRDLLCANNNNSRNQIAGARNNMIGIRSGRADLVLYWKGRAIHIEVKTSKGKQSENQQLWQELVELHGFRYEIIRSRDDFVSLIQSILST
jgi:hypothetical protein